MVTETFCSNDQGHNYWKELLGTFHSINTSVDLVTPMVPLNSFSIVQELPQQSLWINHPFAADTREDCCRAGRKALLHTDHIAF